MGSRIAWPVPTALDAVRAHLLEMAGDRDAAVAPIDAPRVARPTSRSSAIWPRKRLGSRRTQRRIQGDNRGFATGPSATIADDARHVQHPGSHVADRPR